MSEQTVQPKAFQQKDVIDSFPTDAEAWEHAHIFADMIKRQGLADSMGVTVKKAGGAFWVVLVKRV